MSRAAATLRLGTRGSPLARVQAEQVAGLLSARRPELTVEVVVVRVSGGEEGSGGPAASDKHRWVDAIEQALLKQRIDLAVHSAKDLPGELAPGLQLLGAPRRAASEDVLCGASSVWALAPRARVGTSSLRRAAQLRAAREDLQVIELHGNVETRLRRLRESEGPQAIVLARAGLQRLGYGGRFEAVLDPGRFVPAPGQGTLALEGRSDDKLARDCAETISDPSTFTLLATERALAQALGASCHTPLGAHASDSGTALSLRAWVGLPDGSEWIVDELQGEISAPQQLALALARRLRSAGAAQLLERAEELAGDD